jgi:hypothetical protein
MRAILAAIFICLLAQTADAKPWLVTVQTAANIPITVAANLASQFKALIADFVAHGYRPHHIGCYARGGHIKNSRHYAGAACDFDQ